MDFQATQPQRRARVSATFSARNKVEERYWKSFRSSIFVKSYAPIVNLHFSQTSPYRYAVTSGTRIQIYSSKTNRVVKTISKFKEIARSGHIRDDGKLIVAADDSGLVQVFDINSRAVLRSIRAHKQPVHTTAFSPLASSSSPSFLTASDDTTLKVYDLATSSQLSYLAGHSDYVRTASYVPSNPSLIVSGSYDGTIKVWDTRIGGSTDNINDGMPIDGSDEYGMAAEVMSFRHGHPVERILVHPSGTQVVSAGGPVIRVWDLLSTGSCLRAMSNHQKTVTCLEWGDGKTYTGHSKTRLLSAGLDGLVKSYDLNDDYRVGKTMRVSGSVLSLAMAPDEGTLLVGSSTGELTVRQRELSATEQAAAKSGRVSGAETAAAAVIAAANAITVHDTGVAANDTESKRLPNGEIKVVAKKSKKRLSEWDRMLKYFRYGDALDAVLHTNDPAPVFALINELMHRDGLHIALNARNEVALMPILKFLHRFIADPTFNTLTCNVLNVIMEMYQPALGQSVAIDAMFGKIRQKVTLELRLQDALASTKGQVEMILAAQS